MYVSYHITHDHTSCLKVNIFKGFLPFQHKNLIFITMSINSFFISVEKFFHETSIEENLYKNPRISGLVFIK